MLILHLALILVVQPQNRAADLSAKPAAPSKSPASDVTLLSFKEFFDAGQQELKPSAKLLSLNGKRVRILGFMAKTEEHFKGGFYLCPRPIDCDESAGGDADIPPESVFVVLRSAQGKEPAHRPQLLDATGVLELGPKADDEGRITRIRLILDGPAKLPAAAPNRPRGGKPSSRRKAKQ